MRNKILEFAAKFYEDEREKSQPAEYGYRIPNSTFGHAPDSWTGLLDYAEKQGVAHEDLEVNGLVRMRKSGLGYYDKFRGCLVVIKRNEHGDVVKIDGIALGQFLKRRFEI